MQYDAMDDNYRSLDKQEYFNKVGTIFDPEKCKKPLEKYLPYTKRSTNFFSMSNPDLIEEFFTEELKKHEIDVHCHP